jgi:Xaa-Pro aminopeptidase
MNSIYFSRIRKLRKGLKSPACLAVDAPDVSYFTGLNIDGPWLLVTKRKAVIFCPALVREQVKRAVKDIPVFSDGNMLSLLASFCAKERINRVSIDPSKMSYDLFVKINSKIKLIRENDIFGNLRLVKDDSELKLIRKSCKIAIGCFRYIRQFVRPGKSEIEISFKIEEYFLKNGVRTSFLPIVASGPNSALPHHVGSTRKIRKNDTVLIDLGCVFKGYCSDLTRTFFLGKITHLQKKVYSLVETAQKQGIKNLIAGKKAFEIDSLTREVFSKAGYEKYFVHSTGHGVGIEIHEPPRLGPKDGTVLKAGMVVTVEPGIYLPGRFGVRIEDTIEITKKGIKVLTT